MDELIKLLSRLEARRSGFINTVLKYNAELDEIDNLIAEIEDQLKRNGCKKINEHWVGGNEE